MLNISISAFFFERSGEVRINESVNTLPVASRISPEIKIYEKHQKQHAFSLCLSRGSELVQKAASGQTKQKVATVDIQYLIRLGYLTALHVANITLPPISNNYPNKE